MITRARPMAIKRSRVQTRISPRKECGGTDRSAAADGPDCAFFTLAVIWEAATTEDDAGTGISGEVEVAGCFSSGLSIFWCLTFIAWPSRPAPDANCRRCHRRVTAASGHLHSFRFTESPASCKLIVDN